MEVSDVLKLGLLLAVIFVAWRWLRGGLSASASINPNNGAPNWFSPNQGAGYGFTSGYGAMGPGGISFQSSGLDSWVNQHLGHIGVSF